jgi:hypothetical protein
MVGIGTSRQRIGLCKERVMNNYKPFTEYRRKDYVFPRSMKEAYMCDVKLYIKEEPKIDPWLVIVCLVVAVLIVV